MMHKWKNVPRQVGTNVKQIKILVHAQDSCARTTLLCMHNTLVHALEGARAQGQDPKRARVQCLGPAWFLRMHRSVVHAQECCACTRILCMRKNLVHAQESCTCHKNLGKQLKIEPRVRIFVLFRHPVT